MNTPEINPVACYVCEWEANAFTLAAFNTSQATMRHFHHDWKNYPDYTLAELIADRFQQFPGLLIGDKPLALCLNCRGRIATENRHAGNNKWVKSTNDKPLLSKPERVRVGDQVLAWWRDVFAWFDIDNWKDKPGKYPRVYKPRLPMPIEPCLVVIGNQTITLQLKPFNNYRFHTRKDGAANVSEVSNLLGRLVAAVGNVLTLAEPGHRREFNEQWKTAAWWDNKKRKWKG